MHLFFINLVSPSLLFLLYRITSVINVFNNVILKLMNSCLHSIVQKYVFHEEACSMRIRNIYIPCSLLILIQDTLLNALFATGLDRSMQQIVTFASATLLLYTALRLSINFLSVPLMYTVMTSSLFYVYFIVYSLNPITTFLSTVCIISFIVIIQLDCKSSFLVIFA
jgi:hypothetical protein